MAEVGIDLSRELPKPARKKLVSPSRHDPSAWHERLA
jgi:hypothetical protein